MLQTDHQTNASGQDHPGACTAKDPTPNNQPQATGACPGRAKNPPAATRQSVSQAFRPKLWEKRSLAEHYRYFRGERADKQPSPGADTGTRKSVVAAVAQACLLRALALRCQFLRWIAWKCVRALPTSHQTPGTIPWAAPRTHATAQSTGQTAAQPIGQSASSYARAVDSAIARHNLRKLVR